METTTHGIQIHPHHLHIPGSQKVGSPSLTIREQPMRAYQAFVGHWGDAVAISATLPELSFAQLWINSQEFQESMSQALAALGVTNPETLLPSHLGELLIVAHVEGSQDTRPLLFRLHADFPSPKIQGRPTPTTGKSDSPNLRKSSTWLSRFWETLAFRKG